MKEVHTNIERANANTRIEAADAYRTLSHKLRDISESLQTLEGSGKSRGRELGRALGGAVSELRAAWHRVQARLEEKRSPS